MNQPGAIHVCFEVEDLPSICDRMEKAGIEFLGQIYYYQPIKALLHLEQS